MKRRTGRTLLAAAAATMALLAPAGTAHAGLLSASATDCPTYASDTVFADWLDPFHYALAPGGDFETADGWSFTGGAKLVAGNESSYVHGKLDKSSLLLPGGATATSPLMCVGLEKPTARFFARRPSFALLPLMTLEGVYTDKTGATRSLPFVGAPLAGGGWSLQAPLVATGALLELGDHTMMRFRFRAVTGAWQVDDLYVDPWRHY